MQNRGDQMDERLKRVEDRVISSLLKESDGLNFVNPEHRSQSIHRMEALVDLLYKMQLVNGRENIHSPTQTNSDKC